MSDVHIGPDSLHFLYVWVNGVVVQHILIIYQEVLFGAGDWVDLANVKHRFDTTGDFYDANSVAMAKGRGKEVTVLWHWDTEGLQHGVWNLHDAYAAVKLALSVVVVGVGVVPRPWWCRRAAGIRGAAVLDEDVDAFLTSCSPGKEQRGLTTCIATLHVHTILLAWNQNERVIKSFRKREIINKSKK